MRLVTDLKRGTLSGGEISSPDWQELFLDQWQVIEERKGDMTAPDRLWVWGVRGVDDLVARERDTDDDLDLDERLYAVQDGLNQTAIVDTGGAVVERYGYNAFGGSRVLAPNWSSRASSDYAWEIRFGGYRWDAETGLYQVRYRYLHPGLGRWLSRDPIAEQGGLNLYGFVGNEPICTIDLFGLENPITGPGGLVVGPKTGLPDPALFLPPVLTRPFIFSRGSWATTVPDVKQLPLAKKPYTAIVIHHSGDGGRKTPQEIETLHVKKKGWGDVSYNYLISPDGKIYEGRSLIYQGAHVDDNETSDGKIGIIVLGDFASTWWQIDDDPTKEQLKSLDWLVSYLTNQFQITQIGGHKDFKKKGTTECPGDRLYPLIPKKGF